MEDSNQEESEAYDSRAVELESDNPFAAPQMETLPVNREEGTRGVFGKKLNIPWIFGKWFLVCSVSAAPSFFWGCTISELTSEHVIGMLAGVFTFIVGYTIVECTSFVQGLMRHPNFRLTAKIGYGTRMAVSIIFPAGMMLDMFVGMFAVMTVSAVAGPIEQERGDMIQGLGVFYATTIVQGIYLNVVLLAFMAMVYGIVTLARPQT